MKPMVLRVGLLFFADGPCLVLSLTASGTAESLPGMAWEIRAADCGAPNDLATDTSRFDLPMQIVAGLRTTLAGMPPDQPLWLDLLRPYGYLGAAPWERVLQRALERPVLRLPDYLERPQEDVDVLDIGIVFDAPDTIAASHAVWQIQSIAAAVHNSGARVQKRIHVFATVAWSEKLRAEGLDGTIDLPGPSASPGEPSPDESRSEQSSEIELAAGMRPWTSWMSRSLRGCLLDAIHFVCPAEPTATGAVLVLPGVPWRSRSAVPSLRLDVDDIIAVSTQLGAWAALFSPPFNGSGRTALTFLADAVARNRPGPVLCHSLATPDDAAALLPAYRQILSPTPTVAAKVTDGFLYCLPDAVLGQDAIVPALAATVAPRSSLIKPHSGARRPSATTESDSPPPELVQRPNWVGAMQRFLESATLDQIRRVSPDVLLSRATTVIDTHAAPNHEHDTAIVEKTLTDIQDAVKQYIEKKL